MKDITVVDSPVKKEPIEYTRIVIMNMSFRPYLSDSQPTVNAAIAETAKEMSTMSVISGKVNPNRDIKPGMLTRKSSKSKANKATPTKEAIVNFQYCSMLSVLDGNIYSFVSRHILITLENGE